jgi:hypothetical protein
VDSSCGPIRGQAVLGGRGGPRAGTAGINIGRSGSGAHFCVSGDRQEGKRLSRT